MINSLSILVIIIILCASSLGYGLNNNGTNFLYALSLGILKLLGINHFIISIFIYISVPSIIIHITTFIILVVGLVKFIINIKFLKQINYYIIFGLILYSGIMLFYNYNHALGIEAFDSMFYISMVNEAATADFIGKVNYFTGTEVNEFTRMYDFQTYYTLWGSMLYYLNTVLFNIFNTTDIHMNIFIYGASILVYILIYNLIVEVFVYLKLKVNAVNISIVAITLIIFSLQYYHKLFGFYGNTYRTVIVGYLCFELYKLFKEGAVEKTRFFNIALISSALIAVTSTGFPIIVIFVFVLIGTLLKENKENLAYEIGLISLPIFQFALYYLGYIMLIPTFGFYTFLYAYQVLFNQNKKDFFRKIAIKIVNYAPFIIMLYSIVFLNDVYTIDRHFFNLHSGYDMVFNYFSFTDLYSVINILLLISLIYYLFKSKDVKYKKILIGLLLFINPISYVFLVEYLMSVVYYRAFDLIFNIFTVMLLMSFTYNRIKINKWMSSIILALMLYIAYEQYANIYTHVFVMEENYNKQYKVEKNQLSLINYLNKDLYYNDEDRVKVISQFIEIKAFVPKIEQLLDVVTAKNIDDQKTYTIDDELFKVFYPRPFAEINVFDSEVDYTQACELIVDNEADYVVVDKKQAYPLGDDKYFIFEYHVRDCGGDLSFSNDSYAVYRFYWE